jgi:hypothetical protein
MRPKSNRQLLKFLLPVKKPVDGIITFMRKPDVKKLHGYNAAAASEV